MPTEDQIIVDSMKRIGTKWADIAPLLPGRTDNAVKDRWNSTLKRRMNHGGENAQSGNLIEGRTRVRSRKIEWCLTGCWNLEEDENGSAECAGLNNSSLGERSGFGVGYEIWGGRSHSPKRVRKKS
jgi:hypothetical protein